MTVIGNTTSTLRKNADGSRSVSTLSGSIVSGLVFDAIGVTFPNTTTEVYAYKTGGLAGTTVATVTVIYTTTDKDCVLSVERT